MVSGPSRVARHAQDEELAVGAGAGEIGGREGNLRHDLALLRAEDGERVEAERGRDLGRSEDRTGEGGARFVEATTAIVSSDHDLDREALRGLLPRDPMLLPMAGRFVARQP